MRRLIDANALIKEANADGAYGYVDAKQIADAPTVDAVEVEHGRWETDKADRNKEERLQHKHCTACGGRAHFDREKGKFILAKYCHHCGAKMDGGKDNNVPTNADRIRAMSDEELAKQLSHTSICDKKYPECMKNLEECEECLLEWLKQPAE